TSIEIAFEGGRAADLDETLDRLRDLCEPMFDLDGEMYQVDVVFGAAAGRVPQTDELRLVEEAEAALVEARSAHSPVRHDLV
ncbi:hypothetical protein ABTJ66_20820, partial [Acinetobacter baumannii]